MAILEKLRRKYNSIPQAAKASMWFIICNFLQKGINFLTTPIFTRLLSTEDYGVFNLYQTWHSIIYIFATLELASGVFNKGLVKYNNKQDEFTSSMIGLSTLSTVFVFLIFLLFRNHAVKLIGLPEIVFYFLFAELLFSPAITFWSMRERFAFRYKTLVIVTIAIALLSPLLGVILISCSKNQGVARVASVCLINVIFGLFFYVLLLRRGKRVFVRDYWKYGLAFNIPLIPHYLSSIVLGQADRVMINSFFGASFVARYSVAYSLSLLMNIVVTSINATFIPWTYQKCNSEEYSKIGKYGEYILFFVGIVTFIPVLVAPELMRIIAPNQYFEAVYVIPPVSAGVYFIFLYSLYCNIEFAFDENKFVTVATTFAGVANIILNYVFMKLFGYIAAAYTTLACYIMLAVAHYLCYERVRRRKNITAIYNQKIITALSLFVIIGSIIATFLYKKMVIRYVIIFGIIISGITYRKKLLDIFKSLKKR